MLNANAFTARILLYADRLCFKLKIILSRHNAVAPMKENREIGK